MLYDVLVIFEFRFEVKEKAMIVMMSQESGLMVGSEC